MTCKRSSRYFLFLWSPQFVAIGTFAMIKAERRWIASHFLTNLEGLKERVRGVPVSWQSFISLLNSAQTFELDYVGLENRKSGRRTGVSSPAWLQFGASSPAQIYDFLKCQTGRVPNTNRNQVVMQVASSCVILGLHYVLQHCRHPGTYTHCMHVSFVTYGSEDDTCSALF